MLKKLSARKKKPLVSFFDQDSLSALEKGEVDCTLAVVSREKFRPPSRLKPTCSAMASSRVDFPEPFSPTKKHTRLLNLISARFRTTGMVNG